MEQFIIDTCGQYAELVFALIGVCAAVATLLPVPVEGGNIVYKVFYKVFSVLAANFGRAKNAGTANGGK